MDRQSLHKLPLSNIYLVNFDLKKYELGWDSKKTLLYFENLLTLNKFIMMVGTWSKLCKASVKNMCSREEKIEDPYKPFPLPI